MERAKNLISIVVVALPGVSFAQVFNTNPIGPLLPTAGALPLAANKIQTGAGAVGTVTAFAGTANVNGGGLKGQPQAVLSGNATDGTNTIGSLYFQFAGFTGRRTFMGNPFDTAGMIMRGGFNFSGYKSAPGYALGWIQETTTAFLDGTNNPLHLDGVVQDNPMYTQNSWMSSVNNPADATGNSKLSAGFFDGPSTPTNNEDTAITQASFETALVCFNTANFNPTAKTNAISAITTLDVIADFTWNYQPSNANSVSTGIMATEADGFRTTVSDQFLTEFNTEYAEGGTMLSNPGSSFFTLDDAAGDCAVCFQKAATPEPAGFAALALMPMGTLLVPFVQRRRKRRDELVDSRGQTAR